MTKITEADGNASGVSDACDEIQLDWADAKVAQVLCPGGACDCQAIDPACIQMQVLFLAHRWRICWEEPCCGVLFQMNQAA